MATQIPANLKSADIARFVNRGAQVERAKPIIAYWCNFWIVNQIIAKGLHNIDNESKEFTARLMDKLEAFKSQNPDNDAITDNVAGQAYVEQFGLEVLGRAENAMNANMVTAQTADTFQAAATFLELCQIWGELEPEITSKIKFSKYHAVRIARAIKNGEDPNLSNPVREENASNSQNNDSSYPEVQLLQAPVSTLQPTVEEVPDDTDRIQHLLAQQSILDESLHPSRSSSIPPAATATAAALVHPTPPDLPSTPSKLTSSQPSHPKLPDTPNSIWRPGASSSPPPDTFQSFPPPPSEQPPTHLPYPRPPPLHNNDLNPTLPPQVPPPMHPQPPAVVPPNFLPSQVSPSMYQQPPAVTSLGLHSQDVTHVQVATAATVDDQSIALAQKHARWAVSALNFDDVNTAITELKSALRYLGSE